MPFLKHMGFDQLTQWWIRLHGERHLHHRGQERSSQAYDNKVLSKIGKPKTPPGTNALNSAASSPTSSLSFSRQPVPSQLRSLSYPNHITSNYSDSPVKKEPSSRYGEGTLSRPLSPSNIPSSGLKGIPDFTSPTFDQSRRSSTLSSDRHSLHSHQRLPLITEARRSLGSSGLSDVDESAVLGKNTVILPTRPMKRESYDHSVFSDPESTFKMEETVEQLHLEDHPTPTAHRDLVYRSPHQPRTLHSSQSMIGMKRKQMASPPEASQDAAHAQMLQQTANSASQYSQNASHLSTNHFAPAHGSISSQSSTGFRNGSYASSGGPSVAGSSYTTIDQHSPGGISPSDPSSQYQQQMPPDAQYAQAVPLDPAAHNPRPAPYPDTGKNLAPYAAEADLPRKTNENPGRRSNAPGLPANANICQCCPKKPKKFDTAEELR